MGIKLVLINNPENKSNWIIQKGANCNAILTFLAKVAIVIPIDNPHKLPNSIIPIKVIYFF